MIIDDQDAHWHWSRLPRVALRRVNRGHRVGAIAVDSRATRAMLLYAWIRSSPFLSVNARLDQEPTTSSLSDKHDFTSGQTTCGKIFRCARGSTCFSRLSSPSVWPSMLGGS